MAKYNYNKKVLEGLSVGPFLNQVKLRNKKIEEGSDTLPTWDYNANKLADELHPSEQLTKIAKVIERNGAKSFVLTPTEKNKFKTLAYFRAGQYVSMDIKVGNNTYSRPFSISSSPKKALGENSSYMITIKNNDNGFTSKEVNANWNVGDLVTISGPLGEFYYQGLRDAKHIIGIAGGSGITPFISMAEAIADGTEDFKLTIIYGAKNKDALLFKEELDELANCPKVKVVYVLEDTDGFISAKTIQDNSNGEDYSLFVCGPRGLYKHIDNLVKELNIPARRYRKEVFGEFGNPSQDIDYPKEFIDKTFKVTVICRDEKFDIECKGNETLLNAMEHAGIHAPSRCRSGECGWCHSLLISGKIFNPKSIDGRRLGDKKFNWIHPCASYPLSDIVLEIPFKK